MTHGPHTATRRGRRGEQGAVLILFAMLAFGILGVAALTVDVGLVRVTQESMQSAADFAAIEGLRGRDGSGFETAADRELARRQAARAAILGTFDEDLLDLEGFAAGTAPNASIALGIGPDLLETSSDLAGGQLVIGSGGSTVVIPDPQLNGDNLDYGDFVAGEWLDIDPADSSPLLGLPQGYDETSSYLRSDFDPSGAVADPTAAVSQGAFLARLRRTNDDLGLDGVADVSSNAAPLPFVFGRAALLTPIPGSAVHDGLTVRATAVADARPAVLAGLSTGGDAGLLVLPADTNGDGTFDSAGALALSVEAWSTCLSAALPEEAVFTAPGGIELVAGTCVDPVVGRLVAVGQTLSGVVSVGESALDVGEAGGVVPAGTYWVPLYADIDPGLVVDDRVVAFGAVRLEPGPGGGAPNPDLTILRLEGDGGDGHVADAHASAIFVPSNHPTAPAGVALTALSASAAVPTPLLVPVLVR